MAIIFDGPTKLATLTTGTTLMSVRDLWSRWVDWHAQGDNSKFLPMMENVGGNDIDLVAGTSIPIYGFLVNGWRVRPQAADHTLRVGDGVLLVAGGGDPFVNPVGSFAVRISYSQPVQAITVATGGGGGGGDPWVAQLPGSYQPGEAGYILGANLDKKVSDVSLVAVGAALNVRTTGGTPAIGDEVGGSTYLDTYDANGVSHRISPVGGIIDIEYPFDVGADYAPVSITINGRVHGTQNSAQIQAWHWGDAVFRQVGAVTGKVTNTIDTATLFIAHVGTGVDAGKVRIRIRADGVNNDLHIDQMWISYAPLGAFNSSDRALLAELHVIHGLLSGQPLSVNAASRSAGAISQTITEVAGTTTVTRT